VFEEWVGEVSVLTLRFCRGRRKGSALKSLAGALPTDEVGCTFSVRGELKMEILAKETWGAQELYKPWSKC
jgi:hypothetical protein